MVIFFFFFYKQNKLPRLFRSSQSPLRYSHATSSDTIIGFQPYSALFSTGHFFICTFYTAVDNISLFCLLSPSHCCIHRRHPGCITWNNPHVMNEKSYQTWNIATGNALSFMFMLCMPQCMVVLSAAHRTQDSERQAAFWTAHRQTSPANRPQSHWTTEQHPSDLLKQLSSVSTCVCA